ncbi:hypothetical protein SAMN05443582_11542 [Phyllobacterium sp. OV277]|jgi:hypothetical protein|nr:hypothetical protein SAMN05443582_11542 [Phyllobacterium sp. OV277]
MNCTGEISLEQNSDRTSDLRCPRCSGMYLHQGGVSIYHRGEDAPTLTQVDVRSDATVSMGIVDANSSRNPSARRHGLAIRFHCETCNATDSTVTIELTIAQHKGATEIGWRFSPTEKR